MRNLFFGIGLLLGIQAAGLFLTVFLSFGWTLALNILVTVGLLKYALPDRVWALALLVLSLFSVPTSWIARDALPIILGNTVGATIEQAAQLAAEDTTIHLTDGLVATDFVGTNVARAKDEGREIEVVTKAAPLVSEQWSKEQAVKLWVTTTRTTGSWKEPHRKVVRLAPDWAAEAAAEQAALEHGLEVADEPRFYHWTDDPRAWVNDKMQLLGALILGPLIFWLIAFGMGLGRAGD